ncbi:single-stranded DNA-binding protein [Alteribacillus iranensis]|uniref:Single-stranded DNA-binding protein n=1 Tax=Alteribacillus iranensis TaxID=930128 RepID=A0A1I2B0V2_9BACI|nr:single-stranded DNA-binding protein [Alteribacillus iranensis]SFE49528.1 single-strand binding protein [Alteribacillus iranensis]
MFNQVTIVGRFTRDPELTYTKDGIAVCNFTLAVQRSFRNAQGEFDADFIPVTVWRKQAENTAIYCHKGALVGINGRIHTRTYENKEQKKVQVIDVNAEQVRFLKINPDKNTSPASLLEKPPLTPITDTTAGTVVREHSN